MQTYPQHTCTGKIYRVWESSIFGRDCLCIPDFGVALGAKSRPWGRASLVARGGLKPSNPRHMYDPQQVPSSHIIMFPLPWEFSPQLGNFLIISRLIYWWDNPVNRVQRRWMNRLVWPPGNEVILTTLVKIPGQIFRNIWSKICDFLARYLLPCSIILLLTFLCNIRISIINLIYL